MPQLPQANLWSAFSPQTRHAWSAFGPTCSADTPRSSASCREESAMSRTTPVLPQHVAKTALVYVRGGVRNDHGC